MTPFDAEIELTAEDEHRYDWVNDKPAWSTVTAKYLVIEAKGIKVRLKAEDVKAVLKEILDE